MKKIMNIGLILMAFSCTAVLVYFAGILSLSSSPIMALAPVSLILLMAVLYIRLNNNH